MATQLFDITFTLLDAYGRTTTRRFGNNRALLADALTDSAAMLALLEAVSLSAVSKYSIAQVSAVASPSPEAGANNDAGATIHCRMENAKLVGLKVPAIDPAIVEADGTVLVTNEDVAALVGAFATGEHWRISEGNYIVEPVYAELDK
jgi:hypothetical protein